MFLSQDTCKIPFVQTESGSLFLLLGSKQVSGVPFVEFRITCLENNSSTVAVHLLSSGT